MAKRITSLEDLQRVREQARAELELRGAPRQTRITVHMGTCGIAAGARDILSALMDELHRADVHDVTLQQSGCAGLCDQEPMLTLTDKTGRAFRYGRLTAASARQIVREHVLSGNPVRDFVIAG
jgi:NADP-reducing hydrogenase subunit HndB